MPPVFNPRLVRMTPSVDLYKELSENLREADAQECLAMGWTPQDALWFALADCPEGCYLAGSTMRGSRVVPVGAWGWNHRGDIWSLWADLSFQETKTMLTNSNMMLQEVLRASGKPALWNWVSLENKEALHWLAKMPAIAIDRTQERLYGGVKFAPFIASSQRRA